MYYGKKIVVVLPAYNAGLTLEKTFAEIPFDIVDEIILTDDASNDNTIEVARQLGIKHILKHAENTGYGGNQKTCYKKALELNADIIVMLHPDYQYTPKLIPSMVNLVAAGIYPVVLGSRILSGGALQGGMPLYKYIANRFLTLLQNLLMNQKLSEYHTGYRVFDASVLNKIPFENNSDNYIFDNQFIAQLLYHNFKVAEITCPARYESESSSINFFRSIGYGLGVVKVSVQYFLSKTGIAKQALFSERKSNDTK